jgi:hypothetical protein
VAYYYNENSNGDLNDTDDSIDADDGIDEKAAHHHDAIMRASTMPHFLRLMRTRLPHCWQYHQGKIFNCSLLWWHERKEIFPRLYHLMKRFLYISATSAFSERVFSHATKTPNDRASVGSL